MAQGGVTSPCDDFILLSNKNYTIKFKCLALVLICHEMLRMQSLLKTKVKPPDLAMFCTFFYNLVVDFPRHKSYQNYDHFWDNHSLSNEMRTRQTLPLRHVCISGVSWKATWLGVSPARHSLSDRRINSSHGNNIFIFQGQRFSFFPSSCQRVENISWVNAPQFGSGRKGGQISTVEMRKCSLHQAIWKNKEKQKQAGTCGKSVSH